METSAGRYLFDLVGGRHPVNVSQETKIIAHYLTVIPQARESVPSLICRNWGLEENYMIVRCRNERNTELYLSSLVGACWRTLPGQMEEYSYCLHRELVEACWRTPGQVARCSCNLLHRMMEARRRTLGQVVGHSNDLAVHRDERERMGMVVEA